MHDNFPAQLHTVALGTWWGREKEGINCKELRLRCYESGKLRGGKFCHTTPPHMCCYPKSQEQNPPLFLGCQWEGPLPRAAETAL